MSKFCYGTDCDDDHCRCNNNKKMKLLVIGDVHGRNDWEKIVDQEFDKVIFIGDYFDSWSIPFDVQLTNFQKILDFKASQPDKVILLIGNHDYHYLAFTEDRYSGYQGEHCAVINAFLAEAIANGQMQMCTVEQDFLFTHAGVTKTWCKSAGINLNNPNNPANPNNLEGSINKCFMYTPDFFKFMDFQGADNSGNNIYQSPIWVRPESLLQDKIDGYTQVVGHTTQNTIDAAADVIFIDCPGQYLEINDTEIVCHKINS